MSESTRPGACSTTARFACSTSRPSASPARPSPRACRRAGVTPPRHRRGALRLAMGPRLPSRIPRARPRSAQTLGGVPVDRAHRHRRRRHAARHRRRSSSRSRRASSSTASTGRTSTSRFAAKDQPRRQIGDFLAAHRGESGIVYSASRDRAERLAEHFAGKGIRALPYHAGLDQAVRSDNQDVFLREDGVVIFATIAFGMGINKPDVRFVVHADMPASVESYYQEIGRAGATACRPRRSPSTASTTWRSAAARSPRRRSRPSSGGSSRSGLRR